MITVARYGTRDLARARTFWDPIAAMAGATIAYDYPTLVAYKASEGGMLMIGKPFEGEASAGNGTQATMMVNSRADVDSLHAKALELGGTDEGAPGLRGDDPAGFYGAYFRDLDGNKVAVFRFGPA